MEAQLFRCTWEGATLSSLELVERKVNKHLVGEVRAREKEVVLAVLLPMENLFVPFTFN